MRAVRYKSAVTMLLLILAAGFAVFRWWQGPLLSGYSINSMPLVQTVVATGRVVKVSRTQVGSEITGVVLKRLVQEGDRVTRGDLLLVLRSDELTAQVRQAEAALNELMSSTRPQASVDLANTQVQLAQASRELQRRRILAKDSVISKEELEQSEKAESLARNNVESARLKALALAPGKAEEIVLRERLVALQAQLAKTQVSSEVTGIVLTRNVEPGDLVQPSMTLFTIALDGNTEIRVPLDERNLPRLALQQNASVIADAYPDRPFPAQINFIAPSIDPERGTVEVRLTVDPVPDFLRQDMTVSVNIETDQRAHTRVIPNDALGNVQGNKAIVLLLRDGKIHRQTVTLGLRGLAMSEVVSGLQDGEQVLADAVSPLKDGTRARLTLQKISAAEPSNNTDSKNELPVKFD
ncbi:MAG: efflux RND transporter periplasmic adaptor subunit [Acinetobacter harbinensis]|nr:efflux RND transporter periplasmic adaptor subunit [Acinetobacter harbinensis]